MAGNDSRSQVEGTRWVQRVSLRSRDEGPKRVQTTGTSKSELRRWRRRLCRAQRLRGGGLHGDGIGAGGVRVGVVLHRVDGEAAVCPVFERRGIARQLPIAIEERAGGVAILGYE